MGPGILPETTVGKQNPPCHLQMPTKAISCKKEAIYEHSPEALSCPVGQGSFKIEFFQSRKVFYGQTSPNLTFVLEITDAVSSKLKRRETFRRVISIQFKRQHLWWYGCISAYGMGSLHVLEGTMNAERYTKILEQHMLPSRWRLFRGRPCGFQQDNAKPHTAAIITEWLQSRRVRVLNGPVCCPHRSPIENIFVHH